MQDAGAAIANKLVPAAHAMQTSGVSCAERHLRVHAEQLSCDQGFSTLAMVVKILAAKGCSASRANRQKGGKGLQLSEQRFRQVRRLLILMASRGVSWRIWGIRWSSLSRPWPTAGQPPRTQPRHLRVSRGAYGV